MTGALYLTAPEALGELLPDEPRYRSDQLLQWLYRNPVLRASEMTNLPNEVRERLEGDLWPFGVEIELEGDGGATRKWLFRGSGGASIETVLMAYPNRTTLCISSQAGCAMGCTFCATGQFGFERHLEAGEIVAQVAYANASIRKYPVSGSPTRVTNVVYMGMGEPLANYRRVHESLRRLIDVMDMAARSITVSTVGFVPGIYQLADSPWQVNLAVSLHGTDDARRSALVPLNDRWNLQEVVTASRHYFEAKGRRVSIEWTLIDGVNDTTLEADKLADIARQMAAHVNVIPLNPTPLSPALPSTPEAVESFVATLRRAGVVATVRDTRGQDIDAACGQLRVRAATSTE